MFTNLGHWIHTTVLHVHQLRPLDLQSCMLANLGLMFTNLGHWIHSNLGFTVQHVSQLGHWIYSPACSPAYTTGFTVQCISRTAPNSCPFEFGIETKCSTSSVVPLNLTQACQSSDLEQSSQPTKAPKASSPAVMLLLPHHWLHCISLSWCVCG